MPRLRDIWFHEYFQQIPPLLFVGTSLHRISLSLGAGLAGMELLHVLQVHRSSLIEIELVTRPIVGIIYVCTVG